MYFTYIRWLLAILSILLSFSDTYSQAGFIRITSPASRQEVSAHRLSTGVDILCYVEASFLPTITWYSNNTLLSSPNTSSTTSVYDNHTISLRNVLVTTQLGVYSCRVSGRLGSLRSHDHTVNVFAPPNIITPLSDYPVYVLSVGWSSVLPCVPSLESYYSVSWWCNGNRLKSHNKRYITHRGNLHIYKARAGFTGRYYCTVTNKFTNENFSGPVTKLFVSNIKLPVYNTIPQIQQSSTIYADRGSDINLEYDRLYQPLFNISWRLPFTAQPPMAPKITNVTAPSDYSVTVFVNELQAQTTDIQVKINSPPVVRMNIPNSRYLCNNTLLSLSCLSIATPIAGEVSWYHNSRFIATGDTLHLLPVSTTDEGYYQCFAQNQVGTGSDMSLLTFPIAPRVSITQGREVQLPFGSPLTLICEGAEEILQGTFRWTHSLVELSDSNKLYVPYVTIESSGEYTCSVNVCSVTVHDSITVYVSGPVIELTQLLFSPHSVNISWPHHPNAVRYSVAYLQGDQLRWNWLTQTKQVYFVATQLQTEVRYTFRVSYILLEANGTEKTQEYISNTLQLDNAPLILFTFPLSSTQLLIRWQWEGDISSLYSFVIQYKLPDITRNLTLLTSEIDSTNYIETVLSGLQPNSEYSIDIYGVKHGVESWNTPFSKTNSSTTLPKQLTAFPPDLRITSLPLSSSITIEFSQLNTSREYGEVLGYKVLVFPGDFSFSGDFYWLRKNETSLTVPLSPGVISYYIQVLAFNKAGDGPAAELYFKPRIYSTEMTQAPNTTLPNESLTVYLPYLIAIPATVCLTSVVILLVLVGKCAHMYHLNSIKEEAEGVRAKRYYDTHYMVTRNSSGAHVKLQSEHKSISSVTHYRGPPTNPVRERTRTYQASLRSKAVETKLDTYTGTAALQTDPAHEHPLTPESVRIIADTSSVSPPQQHEIASTENSDQSNVPIGLSVIDRIKSAKSTTVGHDVTLALGIHEFAV